MTKQIDTFHSCFVNAPKLASIIRHWWFISCISTFSINFSVSINVIWLQDFKFSDQFWWRFKCFRCDAMLIGKYLPALGRSLHSASSGSMLLQNISNCQSVWPNVPEDWILLYVCCRWKERITSLCRFCSVLCLCFFRYYEFRRK
jgi:hypothetical protein